MTEEKKVKKRKISPSTEISENNDNRHKREKIDSVPSAVKQCVDKNEVGANPDDGDSKPKNNKPEPQVSEDDEDQNAFNEDEAEVEDRKIIVNKFFIQEFRNKILNSDDFITG